MAEPTQPSARRSALLLLLASVVVLLLGGIENLYGLTDSGDLYGSDAVQYLDIARALGRHDWHSALNPLWSLGYPALLALLRLLFAPGPLGDWRAVHTLNFLIFAFSYGCFLYLLLALQDTFPARQTPRRVLLWVGGLSLFVATQVCFGQVSRVNPDELVTALLLLACGMIVRVLYAGRRQTLWIFAALLGALLGAGFLIKAVFLPIALGLLAIAAIGLLKQRRPAWPLLASLAVFACIVGTYGAALSKAVHKPTLGEAGSLNYAWHVNRLQKWVHWPGGTEPASVAWPKPAIARFAQWDTRPPDFGTPLHPDAVLQTSPLVYGFADSGDDISGYGSNIHATYLPYYDPQIWYEGYRHIFRWRYQAIALVKSTTDLATSLLPHPMLYAMLLAIAMLLWRHDARHTARQWVRTHWVPVAIGLLGFAIYLPVHLEGRYLAGFLLLLGLCGLASAPDLLSSLQQRVVIALVLLGLAGDLLHTQRPVWHNLATRRAPQNNVEWQMGEAVAAQGFPQGAPVGVIAWTPNLHCDWAYIAHVRIVSEIATGQDFAEFWKQAPAAQEHTMDAFRRSGAVAVFVNSKPEGAGSAQWQQLNGTPMWMYRL